VGAALTALSLLMLWPLPLIFGGGMLGGGDAFVFTWNFWWFHKALAAGHNPFVTDRLFHPTGTTLWFHDFSPFNDLLVLPWVGHVPLTTLYNAVALFTFVATGLAMYALARRVVGHVGGSFLAAVIVTFAPYRMAHAAGHLSLLSTEWLPVFILFTLRTVEEKTWRNPLLAALAWALCLFCSPYYALYPAFFLVAWLPLRAWRARAAWGRTPGGGVPRDAWARLLAIPAAVVLFTAWFTVPALASLHGAQSGIQGHNPAEFSADLLTFIAPSPVSLFYLPPFSDWWHNAGLYSYWPELSCYVGVVLLTLSVVGFVKCPEARAWVVLGAVFFVLSLGPSLRVFGHDTGLPLPYLLVTKLPVARISGVPARFVVMMTICLALAAGHGAAALAQGRWRNCEWLLVGVVCVEYCCAPVDITTLPAPGWYTQLRAEPGDFAVLDVPDLSAAMHWQTYHGKSLLRADTSYTPAYATRFTEDDKALRALWVTWAKCPEWPGVGEHVRQALRGVDCHYVIAHGDFRRDYLERVLGLRKVYEDAEMRVYSTDEP